MSFSKTLEDIKSGLKELKKKLSNCNSDIERVYLLIAIGNSYLLMSELEETRNNILNSLLSYDQAEKISKKLYDNEALSNIENLKGFLFYKLAFLEDRNYNLNRSIEHYRTGIKLLENSDSQMLISIDYNLGNSYLALRDGNEQDNIYESIIIFSRALETAKNLAKEDSIILINNALGRSYLLLSQLYSGTDLIGILKKAIFYFEESLDQTDINDISFDSASSHNGLGMTLMKMGDLQADDGNSYKDAIKHFDMALKFYLADSTPFDFASVNFSMGICYSRLSQISSGKLKNEYLLKAKKSLENSVEVFSQYNNPFEFANAEYYLAIVYKDLFDASNDASYIENELMKLYSAVKFFNEKNNPVNYATIQFLIGEALYKQGKIDDSINFYNEAERVAATFNENLAKQIASVRETIKSLK
jgi:tetratricopeptide (TPR) repeat protein